MYREKYYDKFYELIQLERDEEIQRHLNEIKKLSGYQREKKGRAFLNMRGKKEKTTILGRTIIKYLKMDYTKALPDSEIKVGNVVVISKKNVLDNNNPKGTVIEKSKFNITIAFDSKPDKIFYRDNVRIDLYVNDLSYKRMIEALDVIKDNKEENKYLINKILGNNKLEDGKYNGDEKIQRGLNISQKEAIKRALSTRDVFLVHGPPGTGKTSTCIEILTEAAKSHEYNRILATAESNAAIDNMVYRLVRRDVKVIRIGHPFRVNKTLREHTLDFMIEDHLRYKEITALREQAYEKLEELDSLTHPSQRWVRGMSTEEIISLAKEGKGSRGVSKEKIREIAEYLKVKENINKIFKKAAETEKEIISELLKDAEVICTTNVTAGSEILDGYTFDLLLMDEASQATEPSSLIPIVKSKKVIFAGDHKQLPPTIMSDKARNNGLSVSMFERLISDFGKKNSFMLDMQYRMNDKISKFPSEKFYDGKLMSGRRNKDWKLNIYGRLPKKYKFAFDPEKPIVFINRFGSYEKKISGSGSVYNENESKVVKYLTDTFIDLGINEDQIGVITPYKAQVDCIRTELNNRAIEVDTVDSFQGRAKDIVILSLVRSNETGEVGFLKDYRRLNVSITRARKKLIVIGDRVTVQNEPLYKELLDYIYKNS